MKRLLFVLCSCLIVSNVFAAASSCETLACVRKNIDRIDAKMIALLGQRLTYVKRAGELKKNQAIYDRRRERKILRRIEEQAIAEGYPASIAIAVFETILRQSVLYEKKSITKKNSHGSHFYIE